MAITVDGGQNARMLKGVHRDPFDEMLIAQSQAHNPALIANDRKLAVRCQCNLVTCDEILLLLNWLIIDLSSTLRNLKI